MAQRTWLDLKWGKLETGQMIWKKVDTLHFWFGENDIKPKERKYHQVIGVVNNSLKTCLIITLQPQGNFVFAGKKNWMWEKVEAHERWTRLSSRKSCFWNSLAWDLLNANVNIEQCYFFFSL